MYTVVLQWSLLLYLHFVLGWLFDDDLYVLVEELSQLNSKWKKLGSELHVRVGKVEASHPSDGLHEVLQRWLRSGYEFGVHWHTVLEALRSIGEEHLASELKVKYGELSTTDSLLMCTDAEFSFSTVDISGRILLLALYGQLLQFAGKSVTWKFPHIQHLLPPSNCCYVTLDLYLAVPINVHSHAAMCDSAVALY